jgi:hypothetical protein
LASPAGRRCRAAGLPGGGRRRPVVVSRGACPVGRRGGGGVRSGAPGRSRDVRRWPPVGARFRPRLRSSARARESSGAAARGAFQVLLRSSNSAHSSIARAAGRGEQRAMFGLAVLSVTASGTRSVLAPTAARRGPGTYRTPPSRGYFRRCRHGFGLKPRMGQGYEHESTSSRVSRGLPDVGPASRPPAADRTYARDAPELVGARR